MPADYEELRRAAEAATPGPWVGKPTIASDEHILVAWAESASGPGWANAPLWYVVRASDGKMRVECLQPKEQTAAMAAYYRTSNCVSAEMTALVRNHVLRRKEPTP